MEELEEYVSSNENTVTISMQKGGGSNEED